MFFQNCPTTLKLGRRLGRNASGWSDYQADGLEALRNARWYILLDIDTKRGSFRDLRAFDEP